MRRGNLFWGLILVILGGLFFLQTTGMITDVLGWFWPLAIILLGLFVLLERYIPRQGRGASGETFSINLEGAARLDLDVDHGAGTVVFSGGAPAGVALTGSQGAGLDVSSAVGAESLAVKISAGPTFLPFIGPEGGEWRFQLTGEVPVHMKVDAGASKLDFDMTDVRLAFLGVDTGASSVNLKLPANAGSSLVDIQAGAASIDLSVPQGVAARIRIDQGASTVNIDEKRFPVLGSMRSLYQSADYDGAPNKVDITLSGGASSINVR